MATTSAERPLYEQVAATLRAAITSGELGPGDPIPSEHDLATRHGMSRQTIRLALQHLTQEGLITSGRGRGRKVRTLTRITVHAAKSESADRRRVAGVDAWVADVQEEGRAAGQSISTGIEMATPEIAGRLNLPADGMVAVRRRLRTVDGEPHNLNTSYYPLDIAEGSPIMYPADVPQGVIALMQEIGHTQIRYEDVLTWRPPTPGESQQLQIPPGVPVLVQSRTGFTTERPVRVAVTIWPGDRTSLVYDLPA